MMGDARLHREWVEAWRRELAARRRRRIRRYAAAALLLGVSLAGAIAWLHG